MAVIWPRVWLNANNDNYGTTDAENSGVVILRHAAIPLAMQDALWAKYKFGEMFSLNDGELPATRNTFAKPLPLPLPGTGVEQLLAKGVLFGVCNVALTIYSGAAAQRMGMDAAAVKQEWVTGLNPRRAGRALGRVGGEPHAGEEVRLLLRGLTSGGGGQPGGRPFTAAGAQSRGGS
jgi:hypothetical protein